MKNRLVFLDTETTGLKEQDRLCQLAYKIGDTVVNELFNPGLPIDTGAMSVHHITNEMVSEKPKFQESNHFSLLKDVIEQGGIVVAHNAPFDIKMLSREGINVSKYICTLKVSRYLDTKNEISSHALQYLRYHFKLSDTESKAHDALGDVVVLEQVFEKLVGVATEKAKEKSGKPDDIPVEKVVARMIEISTGLVPVTRMPFGKYKGKLLSDIYRDDKSYFNWFLSSKAPDDKDELVVSIRKLFK